MSPELEQLLDPKTQKVIARVAMRCLPDREDLLADIDYNDEEQGIIEGWNSCCDIAGMRIIAMFGDHTNDGQPPGEELPHCERDFIQGRNSMLEEVRSALFQLFVDPSYVRVPFTTTPNP